MLEEEEAQGMLNWRHGGGFSVDGEARIEAKDRKGLERLREIDAEHLMEQLAI